MPKSSPRPQFEISQHLERVSRSFAFCIARLDQPLRDEVGLAYLVCRLLDTVEDISWSSHEAQLASFDRFMSLLRFPPELERETRAWANDVLASGSGIPVGEKELLEDAVAVFETLRTLEPDVREILVVPTLSMARGMRGFAEQRERQQGRLLLPNLSEVNRYCFFVAGVVGEILNGLLHHEAGVRRVALRTSLADGFHFGLFLQKVNLLKDRKTDLTEGRDLVPGRRDEIPADFLASALVDARRAWAYLASVPREFESYRLFCAWSLFLGLASLPHIMKDTKIGRLETVALLANVDRKIGSNENLTKLFEHKMEPLEKEFRQAFHSAKDIAADQATGHNDRMRSLESYRQYYAGVARDEDLLEVAGYDLATLQDSVSQG